MRKKCDKIREPNKFNILFSTSVYFLSSDKKYMLCFAYPFVLCRMNLFGDNWSYVFFSASASVGALFVLKGEGL